MAKSIQITAPKTPGSQPSIIGEFTNLRDARRAAKAFRVDRRDLTGQDVRIERDGKLVEYAGPVR